ncbi:radical SAM protein [bacterium]|nr:radical SAM protein [bacterium]
MKTNIFCSEVVTMNALNNFFIEMTAKCCNQHCKHCYIDFPQYKKIQDYIDMEIIKNALNDSMNEDIKCIYLSGAEPMGHPDFNAILRMCLKRSNVCICTNGSYINEKKARFLKKVEEESCNEIIFKLSLDHFDEIKNDNIRYRGAYRQTVFAVKHLVKYNFTPIITVTNYYNEPHNILEEGLKQVFAKIDFDIDKSHIQINPWYDKNSDIDSEMHDNNLPLDCKSGRILTSSGVYTCPFLANDYRGRCGSNLKDYTRRTTLETNFCSTCLKSSNAIFGIDYLKFD